MGSLAHSQNTNVLFITKERNETKKKENLSDHYWHLALILLNVMPSEVEASYQHYMITSNLVRSFDFATASLKMTPWN